MTYLLLLWPLAGWVGGTWAWTERRDLAIGDAMAIALFGAAFGPLLPTIILVDDWSATYKPRPPIVLIGARNKESAP